MRFVSLTFVVINKLLSGRDLFHDDLALTIKTLKDNRDVGFFITGMSGFGN